MSDIVETKTRWRFSQRLPYGSVTLFDGDPSAGKTVMALQIAADASTGRGIFNDDKTYEPEKVVLLMPEDSPAATLKARLRLMDADMSRIDIIKGILEYTSNGSDEDMLNLSKDIGEIEVRLAKGDVGGLILDPINSFLFDVDTNSDSKVRKVLLQLARLAEKYDIWIICIRHFSKDTQKTAMQRGMGSMAYSAVARTGYVFARDENGIRTMAQYKTNLGTDQLAIQYEIVDNGGIAEFNWLDEVNISADDLLTAPKSPEEKTEIEEAKEWLLEYLEFKGRVYTQHIFEDADTEGISKATFKRARDILRKSGGIRKEKVEGKTYWMLTTYPSVLTQNLEQVEQVEPVTPIRVMDL